jgi:hypothetical protein
MIIYKPKFVVIQRKEICKDRFCLFQRTEGRISHTLSAEKRAIACSNLHSNISYVPATFYTKHNYGHNWKRKIQ